jgi:indole-3-glycerol phosphate synthase
VTVLARIVADKRDEVARARARLPERELIRLFAHAPPRRDFAAALRSGAAPRLVAEVKRASPSKGPLRPRDPPGTWRPEELARAYERGGARCLSVLTDTPYFWGSADHLVAARAATSLPVLRKEFVIDPYQVYESRWLGADAVLLIAAILDDAMLRDCAALARELGLSVLVEVHADAELDRALAVSHALVGINHRNLDTLALDMERALRLMPRIPRDRLVVAESGLSDRAAVERLMAAGIEAFLIGEGVAAADDPARALEALVRP